MDISAVPFMTTDWGSIPEVVHAGETGTAHWRTVEVGNIRVRMVRYSAGYMANHWCKRGHVLLVMKGELLTELEDGTVHRLGPGMSYQVANDAEAHRSRTDTGVELFIVD